MNRRDLLQSAVTIPVVAALNSCQREPEHSEPSQSSRLSQGTLKVILNGPFGVVLKSADNYRITAYVPSDPKHEHELFFRGPAEHVGRETNSGASPSYRFELLPQGLEIGQGRPQIDQGFYDFNFPDIGAGKRPPNPFVAVDLPRPDYITFTPPAMPVLFADPKPAFPHPVLPTLQPLDHILEYRISDPDKVRVKSGDKEQRPLSCSQLRQQYEGYQSNSRSGASGQGYSQGKNRAPSETPGQDQGKNMEEMLQGCSPSDLCLFFGVGLPQPADEDHGIWFFNQVLLPTLAPNERRRLQKISCQPATASMGFSSELVPAVFRYPVLQPRLLEVAAISNCLAGGAMGTTGKP